MEIIKKYFPSLSGHMESRFRMLEDLYLCWNEKVNVISRKDISNLYEHHVLHSLGLTRILDFQPQTHVLDVGTGGGFPGIPLAIFYPDTEFMLIDSVGKKIKVVEEVSGSLGLNNVTFAQMRVEQMKDRFEYIVSRAVTSLPVFYKWTSKLVVPSENKNQPNGLLYLKGGDLSEELKTLPRRTRIFPLGDFFQESYFETKKVVFIPF